MDALDAGASHVVMGLGTVPTLRSRAWKHARDTSRRATTGTRAATLGAGPRRATQAALTGTGAACEWLGRVIGVARDSSA
ncbi:hypothetical protein HNR16_002694 [Pseudoclavibacter chungangensis]|nr:hypothetical protein [Pseudoclavibacter chungangensis]